MLPQNSLKDLFILERVHQQGEGQREREFQADCAEHGA